MNDWARPRIVSDQEDATRQLLQAAGPRVSVAPERVARVRAAVGHAWQRDVRQRTFRKRLVLAGAFASAAAASVFFAGWVADPIAIVEAVDGAAAGLRPADVVRVGQWIDTGPGTRLRLRFDGDTSVRVDQSSRMRARSAGVIELASGGIYIDRSEEHSGLEIRTPRGIARDIGTQFEVRLIDTALRLRVRTGMVELEGGGQTMTVRPGTEIVLSTEGAVTRPIAAHGSEWAWATLLSPPLEMEGMTLAAFLAAVAREQGWTLHYQEEALAREAETIILHGSVAGLTEVEAVGVAIASSGLAHRLAGGTLRVFGSQAPRDPRHGVP